MEKTLKKTLAAVLAAAMVFSAAACSDGGEAADEISRAAEEINSMIDEIDWGDDDSSDSSGGDTSASGGTTVIEFGDIDGINDLNSKIDGMSGQTVVIDGIMDRSGFSGYSIGQKDGDTFVGRRFRVEGFSEGDYPAFGSRVKITGTVVYDEETWVSEIVVQPDGFEVIS